MKRNSELAEETFNFAQGEFTSIIQDKKTVEDRLMFLGLARLAEGLGHLSRSIRDLGDMLNRIEKAVAVTKRGPTGV